MTDQYLIRIEKIKDSLKIYDKYSVLLRGLEYLKSQDDGLKNIAMSMPGLIFLLIKWSMQIPENGKKEINENDFLKIVNNLYKLQTIACDLDAEGSFELKLRPMLMQQSASQGREGDDILALKRQKDWFLAVDNSYYNEVFMQQSGVNLETFFAISYYFCAHAKARNSLIIDIGRIIVDLTPKHSIEELIAYLKFVGIPIDKLPDFMAFHSWANNPPAEYFSDTPFLKKPLIISGGQVHIFNRRDFLRSMSTFVSSTLKRTEGRRFKENFGKTLESFVSKLLNKTSLCYKVEDELMVLYKNNKIKGKVVDFIIEDEDRIFLDCKAIEPNDYISTLADQQLLAEGLKESYINAIRQGQECSYLLSKNNIISHRDSFLLVVVHRDHYLSSGTRVENYLGLNLNDEIKNKYGYIPIPLDRVYYITIHDFERLVQSSLDTGTKLSANLRRFVRNDALSETACMLFSMHLDEIKAQNDKTLVESAILEVGNLQRTLVENSKFWDGKIYPFLKARFSVVERINI